MAASLSYLADVDDVLAEDAALYAAPMSHGAGLYNFVHVQRGARHVIPESGGFDPGEILELGREMRNVSMFAAPTMVKRLVDAARHAGSDGDGIKTIVYGGGPMYVADIKEALTVLGPKFVQIYGQGEAPMTITALSRGDIADSSHPDWAARLASVGRAQSVAEVRIVDADGAPLPQGEVGEIAVRGPQMFIGYLDPADDEGAFTRDGFFLMGDLGRLVEDRFIVITGRSKDIIIRKGENIAPLEIENILLQHPDVANVSIVGAPDPERGEIVVAFLVPHPGQGFDMAEMAAHLDAAGLARQKYPERLEIVDTLPMNAVGKVQKPELRRIAAALVGGAGA